MKTEQKGITIPDYLVVMKWLEDGGKCMKDIQKELGLTYKHLHELKHTFLGLEWVTYEKVDRRHNLYLTDKGREIVQASDILFNTMGFDVLQILNLMKKSKFKKREPVDLEKLEKEIAEVPFDEEFMEGSTEEESAQAVADITESIKHVPIEEGDEDVFLSFDDEDE